MDAKELESSIKALNNAVAQKHPDSEVINILEKLKKEVNATEELLRSTRAGQAVARLRANPNKDIGRLALDIVGRWKKQVETTKAKKAKQSTPTPQPSAASPDSVADSKGYAGDPAKRRWELEGIKCDRTESAARNSCIGLMYNGLAYMSTESSTRIMIKAIEVEAAALEAYKGETPEYKTKMRSPFQNLKQLSNADLRQQVLSGDIAADKFVIMTHDELKSQERKAKDKQLDEENMKKAHVPVPDSSISTALQCGKCKNWKVSYTQAQTRSADEPMTTFAECTVCGHRWKFS